MATIDYNITEEVLPIIPIRGLWIFPHNVLHFDIGREISSKAMDEALMNDSKVFLASQKDLRVEDPLPSDFYHIGTVAEIKQTLKLPNGNTRVLVEGLYRGVIDSFEDNSEFYEAKIDVYEYSPEDIEMNTEVTAAVRLLMNDAREYLSLNSNLSTEMLMAVVDIEDPSRLSDVLTSYLNLKNEEYFQLLSAFDVYDRMLSLHSIMKREIEFLHIENNINQKVTQKMNQSQKEYFLREQINVIRDELGDTEDTDQYIDDYMAKLDELELDEDSREYVEKEVKRLRSMSPGSPEVSVVRNFLDHVMDLPWGNKTDDDTDIKFVRKTLEKEHYGLEDVKQRIVEFIAVKKMKGNLKGPIICLVGPPGVGKTSISKSIAHSLNRKFISMRLGGVRDEAEIRGHRRTYIGAMPGRIITLLEKVKVNNPVFLLDEIDKLASDFRGDPASALLEVLDPEQNDSFVDHFMEIPIDLSNTFFVTTANSTDTIPSALLDRMEVIRISGYTDDEKYNIAQKYLIPKQLRENGVNKDDITITRDTIRSIINNYTREAGVRNLERNIGTVVRKAIIKLLEGDEKPVKVTKSNLPDFLGPNKRVDDDIPKEDSVGVVNGLAWTQVGGEILTIEANIMDGSGKVQLTGQLGDVMKESAMAAISYLRSHAEEFDLPKEFYKNKDIHIHVPEGAVPKDGPSAGVTMATAVLSAITGRKIRHDIAMTGEITLRGRVLPIGGVKEKVLAANRYNIHHVILPEANKKDVNDIPEKIRDKVKFDYVSEIKDVFKIAIHA